MRTVLQILPAVTPSPYKNRLPCFWLNPSFLISIKAARAWCGLLEAPPGLTRENSFSREPHTDSHDKHQDPIWVRGISESTWYPVFEDGCTWSIFAHLAPVAAQSCVCRHMAWHPLQFLVPLNPVLDICIFVHLWHAGNREDDRTKETQLTRRGKKKKDKLISIEYVLRKIEEEQGVDVQPGSKLVVSKVKLDV